MADELLERVRAEIDARRAELRPHLAEYQRLLNAAAALGLSLGETGETGAPRALARRRARRTPRRSGAAARAHRGSPAKAPASARAPGGAAQRAIVAALEHGSHTVAELSVVTAMSAPSIRETLRRLLAAGVLTRARREGKAAYALAAPAGG
jgi:Bacterial regulatory protein, arsR family